MFLAIWSLLVKSAVDHIRLLQLAIGLPRGFAKTFFLKIYVVWCILFTDRKFILIVCNTEQLAMNFLSDVCTILDSPNIKNVFGDWKLGSTKDTQTWKNFGFRGRDIILAGLGVGSSLRGLNLNFRRPDLIIMDDMQSREDAEAPIVAQKQLVWMLGTLIKARDYQFCLIVFVGNLYPFKGSILKGLKYNPTWISFICGGILADGQSLWEELRPISELLKELENDIAAGHPEIFYSEVLNDEEAGTVSGLDVSKIPAFPSHLLTVEPQGGFIIIDPATGKENSNNVAIGLFFLFDGVPALWHIVSETLSPGSTIETALKLAMVHGIRCIGVEANAYQATLLYWFDYICTQRGIAGIEFVELIAPSYAKNQRIKDMLPQLIKGDILLHPGARSAVVTQIVHWNPLKRSNMDDILDTLTYTYQCIEKYSAFMTLAGFAEGIDRDFAPPAMTEDEVAKALPF